MTRLHFTVEGQTEETFVKRLLIDHLSHMDVFADVRLVETSREKGKIFRGGMTTYAKARNDIMRWMKQDRGKDVFFTTMFDLYRLPQDFPGYDAARALSDPYRRVLALEKSFKECLDDPRFIPYLQLHEFEALLFSDPEKFQVVYIEETGAVDNLVAVRQQFQTPEHIDDGEDSSPSKRIIKEIPDYAKEKRSAGPIIASAIGLPTLLRQCAHFAEWVDILTGL